MPAERWPWLKVAKSWWQAYRENMVLSVCRIRNADLYEVTVLRSGEVMKRTETALNVDYAKRLAVQLADEVCGN
jgi:hypothetical protein